METIEKSIVCEKLASKENIRYFNENIYRWCELSVIIFELISINN